MRSPGEPARCLLAIRATARSGSESTPPRRPRRTADAGAALSPAAQQRTRRAKAALGGSSSPPTRCRRRVSRVPKDSITGPPIAGGSLAREPNTFQSPGPKLRARRAPVGARRRGARRGPPSAWQGCCRRQKGPGRSINATISSRTRTSRWRASGRGPRQFVRGPNSRKPRAANRSCCSLRRDARCRAVRALAARLGPRAARTARRRKDRRGRPRAPPSQRAVQACRGRCATRRAAESGHFPPSIRPRWCPRPRDTRPTPPRHRFPHRRPPRRPARQATIAFRRVAPARELPRRPLLGDDAPRRAAPGAGYRHGAPQSTRHSGAGPAGWKSRRDLAAGCRRARH